MFFHLLVSLAFGHNSIEHQESNTQEFDTVAACKGDLPHLNIVIEPDGDKHFVCTNQSMTLFSDDVGTRRVRVPTHGYAKASIDCPLLSTHNQLQLQSHGEEFTYYVCASKRKPGVTPPRRIVQSYDPHKHHHFSDEGRCSCGDYNATFDARPHHHDWNCDGYCSCGDYNSAYWCVPVCLGNHSWENGKCANCGTAKPKHKHQYRNGKCSCGKKKPQHTHTWSNGKCTKCGKKKHVHSASCGHNHQRPR